jgi:hypothetical protein
VRSPASTRTALTLAFSVLLAISLLSCGGGNTPAMTQPPVNMTGTFGATARSQTTATNYQIGGIFQTDSSGHVIGHTHIDGSACFDFLLEVAFSGSINAQGQFTLTSSSFNGQSITLTGTLSSDGQTITGGTFTITGGCANGDHGTITGFALSQGFSGGFLSQFTINGNTMNAVVNLSATSPDPSGFSRISGTVTLSNTGSCNLSVSAGVTSETGFDAGADVHLGFQTSVTPVAFFQGVATDSSTKIVQGTWTLNSGPCSGMSGSGALLRP